MVTLAASWKDPCLHGQHAVQSHITVRDNNAGSPSHTLRSTIRTFRPTDNTRAPRLRSALIRLQAEANALDRVLRFTRTNHHGYFRAWFAREAVYVAYDAHWLGGVLKVVCHLRGLSPRTNGELPNDVPAPMQEDGVEHVCGAVGRIWYHFDEVSDRWLGRAIADVDVSVFFFD